MLHQQFGQIQIPAAVLAELRVEEALPDSERDVINDLRSSAGFRIAPALLAEILRQSGEVDN